MYNKESKQISSNTDYLNLLRWGATIAVVFIHVITAEDKIYEKSNVLYIMRNLLNWCVPIFVMISGVLFLNPKKKLSIKKLVKKNIMRIVSALLIFGTFYSWLEIIFYEKAININQIILAIYNTINGKTWVFMWYLYMLIGLYLITPMIKKFLENTDDKTLEFTIIILFIFNSIIPTINKLFNININFYIPMTSIYLLYYLLGYYIHYRDKLQNKLNLLKLMTVISISIIILTSLFFRDNNSIALYNYESPIIVVISVYIFVWIKNINQKLTINFKNGYLCFGIYLIHCFYINIFFKVFNIHEISIPLMVFIPIIGVGIFLLSLLTSYVLNKIKIFNTYIL